MREKHQNVQVFLQYSHQKWLMCLVSLISAAMIHTFFFLLLSFLCLPLPHLLRDWCEAPGGGTGGGQERGLDYSLPLRPADVMALSSDCLRDSSYSSPEREGDRWVGCCRSHCCWMTHADPDSISVTHQSHHSDFAQIRGRWPCCTSVAPAAVSPLPHQGGAADHTGSILQQTATSASLLTFKFVWTHYV